MTNGEKNRVAEGAVGLVHILAHASHPVVIISPFSSVFLKSLQIFLLADYAHAIFFNLAVPSGIS